MLPPGSSAPAVVQMIRWMRSPARTTEAWGARWGDAFTVKSPLFGDIACFSHPEAVKQIFTGDPAVFHAGEASAVFEFFLGPQSVLVLDRAPHLHARRLMMPALQSPFSWCSATSPCRVRSIAAKSLSNGCIGSLQVPEGSPEKVRPTCDNFCVWRWRVRRRTRDLQTRIAGRRR